MVTRTDLLQRACRHLSEAASEADISAALAALPDWSLEHGKLVRCFGLKDYHQNIAFVNAIASVIHQEDHHPELILTYQRCTVKYDTHIMDDVSMAKMAALRPAFEAGGIITVLREEEQEVEAPGP